MGNPYRNDPIWVSLFTQTGSELQSIVDVFKKAPNVVLYNGKDPNSVVFRKEKYPLTMFMHKKHDDIVEWLRESYPEPEVRSRVIITLHGYLRILPPDICERYTIYNGHPGAIDLYPELKGKDPQVRAWENIVSYSKIGSVIHRVTEGVDEGKIVKSVHFTNNVKSLDDTFNTLKTASLVSWVLFLKEMKICE